MIKILSPGRGFQVFIFIVLVTYGVVPFTYWNMGYGDKYYLLLGGLTVVSVIFMIIGCSMPIADYFLKNAKRIQMPPMVIKWWIPISFIIFIVYTLTTAPSIPFISALLGDASPDSLSEERGAFLKGRSGMEIYLIYISTIFVNVLIPYSLVYMFALRQKLRYVLFIAFFCYSVSFLQKALFLNVLMPIIVYYAANTTMSRGALMKMAIAIVGLLIIFIGLTYDGQDSMGDVGVYFLTAQYLPSGALDFLIWRIFAVPIFTAADTLVVHDLWFNGELMHGATSSFIANIFGYERVNVERYVFEYQFGGWNDIANSNAVFFLDGYINFGMMGVIVYSLVTGQFFRVFSKTSDKALSTLWIIFGLAVFSGSLLGLMLGNGWILMLGYALFFKNKEIEKLHGRGN